MKKIISSSRIEAASRRLSKFVACLVVYAAICTPAAGVVAVDPAINGPQGSLPAHRQVAHFRVDRTFNSTGFRTDRFGHGNDSISGARMQPDGKVIAAVQTAEWSGNSTLYFQGVEVIRINPDGTKDTTFGNTCKYVSPTSTSFYWPVSHNYQPLLAIQPDGKIVTRSLSIIMRCNPDGTKDLPFGGGNGTISLNPFTSGSVATMTAQPEGKLILGGVSNQNFALARLNEDGSYDTSFDGDGRALADLPNSGVTSVVIQPDGKIITAGSSAGDFAVARFNADGSLDTSFDSDGKVTTPILSGNESANSVQLQSNGKIVAAGTSLNSGSSTSGVFALVRYNTDGSLDTTFDGDGKVTTPIVNAGIVLLARPVNYVSVQADGRILAGGLTHNGFNFDYVIARYFSNGSLDTSFGAGGLVLPPLPAANDHIDDNAKIVLSTPSSILAIGDTTNWRGGKDITLRQLNIDGSPDGAFGNAGRSDLDVGKQRATARAVVVQPDGKIVVAGDMSTGSTSGQGINFLVRYHADGPRDTSFGTNGDVLQTELVSRLAIGPGGKILAGGSLSSTATLVRYNGDGTIDTSFDTDGKVALSIINSEGIEGMEFQPDGKVLFLNSSTITRLAADGTLDASFDGDGRAVVPGNARAFKLQSDGKIAAVGISTNDFAAARLNADGTLDTTFDGDGVATTDILNTDEASMVAVQPDGKIVLAGRYNFSASGIHMAFVRYNSDGSLDTSFGTNGKTTFANTVPFGRMNIQPDGKILAIMGNFDTGMVRLKADGAPDTGFYADGLGTFRNSKYSANPVPLIFAAAFDAEGRIVHAGADRASTVNNDNPSLFVGRMEIFDHSYVHFDHNGDGRADLAVYRPSNNTWYVLTPDRFTATQLGQAGDKPVPADYDGDGITDLAVYRVGNGLWTMLNSETQTQSTRSMFATPAMPLPADRDGDGYDDVSIAGNAISSQLVTVMSYSESNSLFQQLFGVHGDIGVRGDFDGNGRADIAVFRPSNQTWYILSSSFSQGFYAVQWGAAGDIHVPADYDGDGKTDLAVWRPSTGRWWIQGSTAGLMNWTVWGESTDKPVPADYDGDGKTDIAVWRPSTGTWYIINSADSSIRVQQFGQDGDIPLPNAFIY